jgi:MFS family permease
MLRLSLGRFNKNVHLLFVCQALANTGMSLVATTTALAAQTIASDQSLVTLPYALQFVATMASTGPASFLMRRIGRRNGFSLAAGIVVSGALLSAYALMARNLPLYCLGGVLIGSFNAFAMYYRFTAAEVASETMRSKAISYVLAGGVVAAFCGPGVATWAKDLLAPVVFAGSFTALAVLGGATFVIVRLLEVPDLPAGERKDSGRPISKILRQPICAVAITGAMLAYATMSTLMTSTPLAMADCGHSFGDTAFVIQWHVLGMYGPALFMGHVIARFGAPRVIVAGVFLMLACVGIDLAGVAVVNFWLALVLLGVGWSAAFVGSTSLLTYAYRPAERAKVQALNDTLVFAAVALGSFVSGVLQNLVGWSAVNLATLPGLLVVGAAVVWLGLRRAAVPALDGTRA